MKYVRKLKGVRSNKWRLKSYMLVIMSENSNGHCIVLISVAKINKYKLSQNVVKCLYASVCRCNCCPCIQTPNLVLDT